MTAPRASFPARLALARRLIARGPTNVPAALADQLDAAARDTRVLHDRIGAALPILEPERNWRQRQDDAPSDETRAYLLAALLGCNKLCIHLRRGGPRPAIARLALGRTDCECCARTLYRPAAEDDDRCDVCHAPETLTFHPFAVRMGPLLLTGDACSSCARTLGIDAKARAS